MKKKNNILKIVLVSLVAFIALLATLKFVGTFTNGEEKDGYTQVDLTWRKGELDAVAQGESGINKLEFKENDKAIYSSEFEFAQVFEIVQDFESDLTYKIFVSHEDSGWVELGPKQGDYNSYADAYISGGVQKVRIVIYADEELGFFDKFNMANDFTIYVHTEYLAEAKENGQAVEE